MFPGLIKASSILKHGEKKGIEQFHLPRRQQPPPCSKRCWETSAASHEKLRQIPKTFFLNSLRTIPYNTHATGSWENEAGPSSHSFSGFCSFFEYTVGWAGPKIDLERQHLKHLCEDERQLYFLFNLSQSRWKKITWNSTNFSIDNKNCVLP